MIRLFLFVIPFLVSAQDSTRIKELKTQIDSADDSTRLRVFESITDQWLGVNLDSSLYYADKMLEIARTTKDPYHFRRAYIAKGFAYGYLYKFENERENYQKALQYSLPNDDKEGIAIAYLNTGVSYLYEGSLDSAAYYFEKARPIFIEIQDSTKLSHVYNNLGLIYRKIKRFDKAIEMYNSSMAVKEELGDQKGLLNTYINLTSLYIETEKYKKVLPLTDKIKTLSGDLELTDYYVSGLCNAGIAYKSLENYSQAEKELSEAKSLLTKINDLQMKYEVNFNLADLAFDRKEYEKSIRYLREVNKWGDQYKAIDGPRAYHNLYYKVAKAIGNIEEALHHLEKYTEINEKYLNEKSLEQINDLQGKYELEKKERTITELELEQKQSALALAQSKNQRNIFISATLIILILAGFFYYRYNVKQKTSKLLSAKNKQITVALNERETLLKEIHHRVKNNLQVISSLLNLQAGSLEDESAIGAVREGQSRVKSMALIHQKLYSADDVRGVDVQDYLENLSAELFSAFGVDEERIKYKIDTSGIKLDIDTVIPLGLIINELITNTIKYAFDKSKEGMLQISMREDDNKLNVEISDNGKGMNEEALQKSNSFGWKMIKSLSRKLKAEIKILTETGTTVQLTLSRYKLVS